MALQPVSPSGATFATGALADATASRALGNSGASYSGTALVDLTASRALGVAGAVYDSGAFVRSSASRLFSIALVSYDAGHFVSLSSFRALSQAIATYALASMSRQGASRPLSPGYSVFVPAPPPPPGPPPDTTPPFVGNYSPAAGTPISKGTSISFDVTDDSGAFRKVFVVAYFPDTGVSEVIHDGDGFRGFYTSASSRKAIAGGFRYTVLRGGGWPGAPTIQTFAIDLAGNEAN